MSKFIPTVPEVTRETITLLAGLLIAAWVLSRFPKLQNYVRSSSITVDDKSGNNLW